MLKRHVLAVFRCLLLAGAVSAVAQDPTPVVTVPNPPNTAVQQKKHYVVLISLDGFRYDYPRIYGAPHLLKMGTKGASAPKRYVPLVPVADVSESHQHRYRSLSRAPRDCCQWLLGSSARPNLCLHEIRVQQRWQLVQRDAAVGVV